MREVTTVQQMEDYYWGALPEKAAKRARPRETLFRTDSLHKINAFTLLTDHLEKYLKKLKLNFNTDHTLLLQILIYDFEENNQRGQNYRGDLVTLLDARILNYD